MIADLEKLSYMVQGGAGARGQAPGDGAGNAASLQATDPSAPPAAQQRRRGPAITEPAKSVAIASKNFFKGMRDTMHEAASSERLSAMPRRSEGGQCLSRRPPVESKDSDRRSCVAMDAGVLARDA